MQPEVRIGHEAALQRSSRADDGTPLHIRMDGTGFDNMDVPDGTNQPKLQFTVMVPTAEFFRAMRVNAAALDLQEQFGVNPADNGLERFMTATRRQNFLMPPRRHRAFPLLELMGGAAPNSAPASSARTGPAPTTSRTVTASTRTAANSPQAPPTPAGRPQGSGGSPSRGSGPTSGGGGSRSGGSRGGGGSGGGRGGGH